MTRAHITFNGRRRVSGVLRVMRRTRGARIYVFRADGLQLGSWLPWAILRWLPLDLRIPKTMVIKHYDNAKSEADAFKDERSASEALDKIQGDGIPYWYGQVQINNTPALAVAKQYLRGRSLLDAIKNPPRQDAYMLCEGLTHCFHQISTCGVLQLDAEPNRLDDLMLVTLPRTMLVITIVSAGSVLVLCLWSAGHLTATLVCVSFCSFPNNVSVANEIRQSSLF